MATVPSPTSATVGQKLTASFWNTQVATAVSFLTAVPLFSGYQNASGTQTLATATWTVLNLNVEDGDRENGHSTTTNAQRYTSQTPGWYLVIATATFAANATGMRGVRLQTSNNGILPGGGTLVPAGSGNPTTVNVSVVTYLGLNDYVDIYGYQTSGGNLATSAQAGSEQGARMSVVWLAS